jgi:hypothetical protein
MYIQVRIMKIFKWTTVHKKKILSPSPAAIVEIEPIFFANFPCPPLYLEAQRT